MTVSSILCPYNVYIYILHECVCIYTIYTQSYTRNHMYDGVSMHLLPVLKYDFHGVLGRLWKKLHKYGLPKNDPNK